MIINWQDVAQETTTKHLETLARTSKPASDDARELMLRMGRVPYRINFVPSLAPIDNYEPEKEVKAKDDLPHKSTKYRLRVKTPEEGNVWSSYAYIRGEYHLPVLDVDARDKDIDNTLLTAFNTVAGHEVPHEWVPSTTPGHWHLYVNWPYHWDDYQAILLYLRAHDVIEEGYIDAALKRGATFVRFPWEQKPDLSDAEFGPFPWEVRNGRIILDADIMFSLFNRKNDLVIFHEPFVGLKDWQKPIYTNISAA